MADHLREQTLPEEMIEMADDYLRGVKRSEALGTAAVPRQDISPAIMAALGLDPLRTATHEEVVNLLRGYRADGEKIPGNRQRYAQVEGRERITYVDFTSQPGFGIFNCYSAYASGALNFSLDKISDSGSLSLMADTKFGDLAFTGADTIGVLNNDSSLVLSGSLTFVSGSDTFSLASGSFTQFGSGLSKLQHDLDLAYSATSSIKSALRPVDTVAAATAGYIFSDSYIIKTSAESVLGGGSTTYHTLSNNTTIHISKLT